MTSYPPETVDVRAAAHSWGDGRAIELALGQLIFNGIKYSRGNSYIKVNALSTHALGVEVRVQNKSVISLPDDLELLYEFGWRSTEAKELHVNGSGIGLFTVRKIVYAHRGTISASEATGNVVTFKIQLPTLVAAKKDLLELNY